LGQRAADNPEKNGAKVMIEGVLRKWNAFILQ
jgi:hypothetical protein